MTQLHTHTNANTFERIHKVVKIKVYIKEVKGKLRCLCCSSQVCCNADFE